MQFQFIRHFTPKENIELMTPKVGTFGVVFTFIKLVRDTTRMQTFTKC